MSIIHSLSKAVKNRYIYYDFHKMKDNVGIIPLGLSIKEENELYQYLLEIVNVIHKHGKKEYMYLPGDIKLKISPLLEKVIEQRPDLKFAFEKNINFTNEDKITAATFKAREDLNNRIANILIKASAEMTNLNTFKVSRKKEAAFSDYIQEFKSNSCQFNIKKDIKKELVLDQMTVALSKLSLNEPVMALSKISCAIGLDYNTNQIQAILEQNKDKDINNSRMKHSLAYIKAINVLSSAETEELKMKIAQVYPEGDFQGMAYNNLKGTPIENLRSLRLENPVIDNLANFSKALLVSNMALHEDELKDFLNVHVKGATTEEIDKAATKAINAYVEDQQWGRVTVVYKNEWEQMFKVLNVKDDAPEWIYGGDYTPNVVGTVVNAWKSLFAEIERNERDKERELLMLKRRNRMNGSLSKQAQQELQRKGQAAIQIEERF